MSDMFDILIENALVMDGGGGPGYIADLGISDGKIAAIGRLDTPAARVMNASGLVASPGFVDIHSHTDSSLLIDPRAQSKITQGITLEVCGNCGFSPAPCVDEVGRAELQNWRDKHDIEDDWSSMDEFLSVLERRNTGINFLTLVGHANLRSAAVGLDDREASPEETEQMKRMAAQAMREGAFGVSSGLIYAPSSFGNTDELVNLAQAVAPYGGIYASHIRSERDEIVDAVKEAIEIGRRAGVPVQIAHHKACGSHNWGKVKTTLELVREARETGTDVSVDQYPYTASATTLAILLPDWVHDGGDKAALERIRDKREELIAYLAAANEVGGWIASDGGYSSVVVSSVRTDRNRGCEGKNIIEISQERGSSPEETVLDLLAEEGMSVSMVHFAQCEEDVLTVMRSPHAMIGTDASARSTTGKLARGKPHPRTFGTFPRVLGRYVREQQVISLETAIRKMTSMPAQKLRLIDRGMLAPGYWADVVVFDPDKIMDKATYSEPHQICEGIEYVFVNGCLAVEHGELTGELAGRVIRRK